MLPNTKNITAGARCWTAGGSSFAGGFEAVKRVKKRPSANQAELKKDTCAG
jgi:hypothetical protein